MSTVWRWIILVPLGLIGVIFVISMYGWILDQIAMMME